MRRAILADQSRREENPRPISLAGSRKQAPVMSKDKRRHVVELVIDMMRPWNQTPFEHEGAIRHGIRSGLCLEGYGWQRSDAEASAILAQALRIIGVPRPTWEQGQREYADPRENCVRCAVELPEDMRNVGARFCSEECARFAIQHRDFETRTMQDTMYQAAQYAIQRLKHRARCCERCDTPYRPLLNHSRFCSKECADLAAVVLEAIDCRNCGATFQPKNRYAVYCSRICSSEGRVTTPERQCVQCNKTFRRAIGNIEGRGKFCSRECAVAARSSINLHRECECCGTPYTTSSHKALYCSKRCAQIVSGFRVGRNLPKRISPPVLDYLFRRQGLRITTDRMAA